MMQLCRLPILLLVVGWTTVTHFSGVSPNSIFIDYSLSKIVQLELLQIQVTLLTHFTHCNSLFRSLSKFNLHRLQSIQNIAARIVTNSSNFTKILQQTPLAPSSASLRVQTGYPGVQVYSYWFPKYFAPYLSTYHNTCNTRCSQSVANFLNVPKFQPKIHKSTKQFGFSFTFDAPTVCNSLLEDIRASPTIASFRKKLKTYLHTKAYPP